MAERGGEYRKQQTDARKRAEREAKSGFEVPFHKGIYNIGSAEEKGVEHEVILRHQTEEDAHTDSRRIFERGGAHLERDEISQSHRLKHQKDVHPYHEHGGKAHKAQSIQHRDRTGDLPAGEEQQ